MDGMTDFQFSTLLNLLAEKIEACKTMEDVKKLAEEVKEMAKKEKASK